MLQLISLSVYRLRNCKIYYFFMNIFIANFLVPWIFCMYQVKQHLVYLQYSDYPNDNTQKVTT